MYVSMCQIIHNLDHIVQSRHIGIRDTKKPRGMCSIVMNKASQEVGFFSKDLQLVQTLWWGEH